MNTIKLIQSGTPNPLEIALQLVETLGKSELVVLPKKPSIELIQTIMAAGNVNEANAKEIYHAIVTAVG